MNDIEKPMKHFQKIFYFFAVTVAVAAFFSLIYSDIDTSIPSPHDLASQNRPSNQTDDSAHQNLNISLKTSLSIDPQITKKLISQTLTNSSESQDKLQKALKFIRKQNRGLSSVAPEQKNLLANNLLSATPWKIWANTKVVHYESNLITQQILGRVSNLAIVDDDSKNDPQVVLKNFDTQNPVAVYDTRLKKPGVLTGTIKVVTHQKELLEEQLKQYQAHIDIGFDEIHTYFVTSQTQLFNLENLYNGLINQPYITKVELEVLSKTYEKN